MTPNTLGIPPTMLLVSLPPALKSPAGVVLVFVLALPLLFFAALQRQTTTGGKRTKAHPQHSTAPVNEVSPASSVQFRTKPKRKGKHGRHGSNVPAAQRAPHRPHPTPTGEAVSQMDSSTSSESTVHDDRMKQPFDAVLVVDVEGTCEPGHGFDYPNEIIEWPVVLMRWSDKSQDGRARSLVPVAEFRSFVRPTWRPRLSTFCTALTGITQDDVDRASTWPEVMDEFDAFLIEHGLIDAKTLQPLQKFVFCSDGPFDIRDFVVKQSYISQIPVRTYLQSDILDVRKAVTSFVACRAKQRPMPSTATAPPRTHSKRPSMNIAAQLQTLNLGDFIGRAHCGIDDARNIARIVATLASDHRLRLEANTYIHPNRRFWWMSKDGTIDYPDDIQPYAYVEQQLQQQQQQPQGMLLGLSNSASASFPSTLSSSSSSSSGSRSHDREHGPCSTTPTPNSSAPSSAVQSPATRHRPLDPSSPPFSPPSSPLLSKARAIAVS